MSSWFHLGNVRWFTISLGTPEILKLLLLNGCILLREIIYVVVSSCSSINNGGHLSVHVLNDFSVHASWLVFSPLRAPSIV